MKKILIIMILAIGGVLSSPKLYAQGPPNQRNQEIRNMKIAFIANAIELTPEESQKFWPQYNQYWNERRVIGHRRRDLFQTIKEGQATDATLREYISIMDAEKKLTEKYMTEFKKTISVDKVAKLFVADEDFKHQLLKLTVGGARK